ncbi:MAG: hypothetical protein V4511_01110 [Bacteroidota bacterium]
MEPKLNPQLKRILSNPEFGNLVTKGIISNNNKISTVNVVFEDLGIEVEITPIGYSGYQSNSTVPKK